MLLEGGRRAWEVVFGSREGGGVSLARQAWSLNSRYTALYRRLLTLSWHQVFWLKTGQERGPSRLPGLSSAAAHALLRSAALKSSAATSQQS